MAIEDQVAELARIGVAGLFNLIGLYVVLAAFYEKHIKRKAA